MVIRKVAIIDFGAGNLRSIFNALDGIPGVRAEVTQSKSVIEQADFIVMPGVGAFDKAMISLRRVDGLVEVLCDQVLVKNKPFLGICIGMQILADCGYENGEARGLSFVAGEVRRLPRGGKSLLIPHMGWNNIVSEGMGMSQFCGQDFYFVHSYYFDASDGSDVVAYCDYGIKFPCILQKENILATQFHPEKSGSQGVEFLKYFIR
ncbi:MAG: imidazole glycerol phosphate synthase subunit HisH [Rickettsiales bacterium]|jgi:imidazole glycerol-phosphate synthase subunit HisH|nr:imidazole glycerol phosphate synthase subunit HisH [Rickettsiales bacterium]